MSGASKQQDLDSAGRRAYLTKDDVLISDGAVGTGGEDKTTILIPGSRDVVALWDDFLTDTLPDEYIAREGDTGNSFDVQSMVNGVVRGVISATNVTAPTGGTGLVQNVRNWKANQGRLRFAARVKIPTLGGMNVFVGLTDSTAAEMPAYDTGGELITAAADCIGFLYSNTGSTTKWRAVSARSTAGDSGDPTPVVAATGPTANVWDELEFKVDGGNLATFWVNARQIGYIKNPVDSTVALTPSYYAFATDTGLRQIDLDYWGISAARDTGE